MGMRSNRRLLKEIAADVADALDPDDLRMAADGDNAPVFEAAHKRVKWLRPETLGRLSACGIGDDEQEQDQQTSLYEVHLGSWLDKHDSGRGILRCLAATAVAAAALDLIHEGRKGVKKAS